MAPTGSSMTEHLSVCHMTESSFGAAEEPSPLAERFYIEQSRMDILESSHLVLNSGTQSQKLSL